MLIMNIEWRERQTLWNHVTQFSSLNCSLFEICITRFLVVQIWDLTQSYITWWRDIKPFIFQKAVFNSPDLRREKIDVKWKSTNLCKILFARQFQFLMKVNTRDIKRTFGLDSMCTRINYSHMADLVYWEHFEYWKQNAMILNWLEILCNNYNFQLPAC